MENTVGQSQVPGQVQTPQTVQVPNYSGVNIQIFNPSVAAPGATLPASTINTNNYSTNPCCYPANYYTQNLAQVNQGQTASDVQPVPEAGKNKMQKRKIVQLTDDYIKTLEQYLNSQNKEVRLMGAKEVSARLQEDENRKNDPALNALVNKMLQDPYQPVRLMAMGLLDSRFATGNTTSVKLLKGIEKNKTNYGEDSLQASKILLRMSGNTITKEFEVTESQKNKGKK